MAEAVGSEAGSIDIMVCGKTGIGKSTLLNILLGTKDKFVVNGPGSEGDDCMAAGTEDVISVSERIHGIKVTMYDTPGLQSDHEDEKFIKSMEKVLAKIDLVLFCIDSTSTRWVAEAQTVKTLHLGFGNEFWTNAIFVLTRSNMSQQALVEDDDLSPEQKIAKCEKAATSIFKYYLQELKKCGALAGVVNKIPLVAVGSHKKRKLHFVAPKVYDEDFLPELWSLAVKRCRGQKKLLFAMASNYKQMRFILQDDFATLSPEEQDQIRKEIQEQNLLINALSSASNEETDSISQCQPIQLSKKQSNRVHKSLATGLGAGLGGGAAALGAFISLSVLGGPIGLGVGAAVGLIGYSVLTGVLVYHFIKSKKKAAMAIQMETTL